VALGGPSGPSYVSSKAALVGLTRSLARTFGPTGVTVNALSPGAILTEREIEILGDDPHAGITDGQVVPRTLVPDDLLTAVRFLVADGSGAMTGQVLEVGAGLVLG
jgi:NAD(P)-dependent dehydrogenase (short-subunit alcohol dehydrogenase family)